MMIKQSKRYHESAEKSYKLSFKQFWLISTQNSSLSSISVKNKLILWQIDDLILTLINKLVTAVLRADKQYNYYIRETDSEMKYLIWVLSLQVTTWSKIRLTADDFVSYRKTLNSLSQRTVSSDIFISKSTLYSSFNLSEKNMIILSLIKDIQKFNLQCR